MPLYDCQCSDCDNEEEQLLKREDEPTNCEVCGGKMVRKKIQGSTSFTLLGTGWAFDGYSKRGK